MTGSPILPRSPVYLDDSLPWTMPIDNWNISSLPRSIIPHLTPKNHTHDVPQGHIDLLQDQEILNRLKALKVNMVKKNFLIREKFEPLY